MCYFVSTGSTAGKDCGSQPEGTFIGKRHSIGVCSELENGKNRTKNFFPVRESKIDNETVLQASASDDCHLDVQGSIEYLACTQRNTFVLPTENIKEDCKET